MTGAQAAPSLGARRSWFWPNGARIALWVIPNVEVFDAAAGEAEEMDPRSLSQREYGNRVGLWRIRDVLADVGVRGTVALNASAIDAVGDELLAAVADGWEMMGHGDVNNHKLRDYEDEEASVAEWVEKIRRFAGDDHARGWLSPGIQPTKRTAGILAANGVTYTADCLSDDQPYRVDTGRGELVALPYTLELNDMNAFERYRFDADQFERTIRRQFDRLYRDSQERAIVMAVSVHPYVTGVPHRIEALRDGLAYALGHEGVWAATGSEIVSAYRGAEEGKTA